MKFDRSESLFLGVETHLIVPVFIVGIGGGIAGALYLALLEWLTDWLGPGEVGASMLRVGLMVLVGVAVTTLTRWLGPSGNVELLVDNIHVLGGADDVKRLRSLVPTSLLCIAAGGTLGPEAPLVQACGSLGTWVSGRYKLSARDLRVLTITGMAAGFSVLFGTPLGAALFALEILHRRGLQYYEALLPALVGSLAGFLAYTLATSRGLEPMWHLPPVEHLSATDLGWSAICGVLGAVCAIAFTLFAVAGRRLVRPIPNYALPALGGLGLGLLAFWSPFALTNGEGQVQLLLVGGVTAGALVTAALAKLVGTLVTLTAGWKGGFIIPLIFIGFALGQLIHLAVPSTNLAVLMISFAVALLVGVTKTPLGSAISVTGMAGIVALPVALLAGVIALLLTSGTALIETQRERAEIEPEQQP